MVILEPSQGIKKATGIDFDILGDVVSLILMNTHRKPVDFVCKIHKSREAGVSQVTYSDHFKSGLAFDMLLDQTSRQSRKFVFGSILHELRHCCQLNIWKYWTDTAKFNTYEDYYDSKEEMDARKAEKLTKIVIKMYDAAIEAKKQYVKYGLTKLG
tara:strand:- start:1519 stop:1986 length:468 start_codon:yes stop_codon:yes gene_type:complete